MEQIVSRFPEFMTDDVVAELLNELGFVDLNAKWVKGQADAKRLGYVVVAKKRRYRKDMVLEMVNDWMNVAASPNGRLALGGPDAANNLSQDDDAAERHIDTLAA
ncbi:hypothetical protein [Ruegeria arenilitoris]|uniref:hypothetical protein n=1 Tax=Ruegeria arenilitoris TaxID=1173585 RepID=UPI00147A0631|nr:hypothetical protein [Ruegeria arenilitoris]